jgi:hypothetical protein
VSIRLAKGAVTYVGSAVDGCVPHGEGKLTWGDKTIEGTWVNGLIMHKPEPNPRRRNEPVAELWS